MTMTNTSHCLGVIEEGHTCIARDAEGNRVGTFAKRKAALDAFFTRKQPAGEAGTILVEGWVGKSFASLVAAQLSAEYKPLALIASNTGITTLDVLDALAILERRFGVGRFIDVSSRDNVSVRLRPEAQLAAEGRIVAPQNATTN